MPYSLTQSQTLKDRATQLLIDYKSGALVTQLWLICQSALFQLQSHHHTISPFAKKDKFFERAVNCYNCIKFDKSCAYLTWLGLATWIKVEQGKCDKERQGSVEIESLDNPTLSKRQQVVPLTETGRGYWNQKVLMKSEMRSEAKSGFINFLQHFKRLDNLDHLATVLAIKKLVTIWMLKLH